MNVPGGENVAVPLGDARLEELEYLAELERDWEGRTEKHAGDTLETRGEGYRGDGGDEVFVIIPALPFSQAAEIARCILQEINRKRLAQWPEVRLSASFGLACTEDPSQNPHDLVSKADDLMYSAKQKSKDFPTSHLALQDFATIEVIDSAPTS